MTRTVRILTTAALAISMVSSLTTVANAEPPAPAGTVYVAPSGDDAAEGSIDAPLATLQAARDKARALRSSGLEGPISIMLRDGTYSQSASLELGDQDSDLTITTHEGETARITGARTLDMSAASPVTDTAILARLPESVRSEVVQIDLRAQGITTFSDREPQVAGASSPPQPSIVSGDRWLVDARYPNEGWLTIADVVENAGPPTWKVDDDHMAAWSDPSAAWVYGFPYFMWAWQTFRVTGVDRDAQSVSLAPESQYGSRAGNPFYFFHVLEELDTVDEFFVDATTGLAYFMPVAEEEVRFTTLTEPVINIDGADRIQLEGLTVADSRGRGIRVANSDGTRISETTFLNLGLEAVEITDTATNSGVKNSTFRSLGNGGVILDGGNRSTLTPGNNFVTDSTFSEVSEVYLTYAPGIRVRGVGNIASHNEIFDLPHTAITVNGNENVIEYNHIHHVVLNSSDAGALYTGRDWTEHGNVIRYNYFHDVGQPGQDVIGVYLDDMSSGFLVYGNVFVDVPKPVQHSGRHNVVMNNVMVDADHPVFIGTWGAGSEPELRTRLNAVPYQDELWTARYPELAGILDDEPTLPKYNSIVSNAFVVSGDLDIRDVPAQTLTLRSNLQLATVAEAGFVNAAGGDYTLGADSPILAIPGFEPIPFGEIGPRQAPAEDATPASVELYTQRTEIPLGLHQRVWAVAERADGIGLPTAHVGTFTSSNPEVISISTGGYLETESTGTATITYTATIDGVTLTDSIQLTVGTASAVRATPTTSDGRVILEGATTVVGATLTLSDGTTATALQEDLTFESSDTAVATVATDGTVTAVAPGITTIAVTLADDAGTTTVNQSILVLPADPAALPEPWQATNVGTFTPREGTAYDTSGFATLDGDQLRIYTDGRDVFGSADQFTYVHQSVSADDQANVTLTSTVGEVGFVTGDTAGGIMLRDDVTGGAAHANIRVTPSGGVLFVWRTSTDGGSGFAWGGTHEFPVQIRLLRDGNNVTGQVFTDGAWQTVGSATVVITGEIQAGAIAFSAAENTAAMVTLDLPVIGSGPRSEITLSAVGDSITETNSPNFPEGDIGDGSWVYYTIGDPIVWNDGYAKGGARTDHLLPFVEDWGSDVAVVMAGSNDITQGTQIPEVVRNVEAIARASGGDRVIISAVPPNNYGHGERILQYNNALRQLAALQQWEFVDPWADMRAEDGTWTSDQWHSDGIHPTKAAAEAVAAIIREATLFQQPAPPVEEPAGPPLRVAGVGDTMMVSNSDNFNLGNFGNSSPMYYIIGEPLSWGGSYGTWNVDSGVLAEGMPAMDADVLVLVLGREDVGRNIEWETTRQNIITIVEKSTVERVILSGTAPSNYDPQKYVTLNQNLQALAEEMGWEYVHAAESFMNRDGTYTDDQYTSDGFWPNVTGIRLFGLAIRAQILNPPAVEPIRVVGSGDAVMVSNSPDFDLGGFGDNSPMFYIMGDPIVHGGKSLGAHDLDTAAMATRMTPLDADVLLLMPGRMDVGNNVACETISANLIEAVEKSQVERIVISGTAPSNYDSQKYVALNTCLEALAAEQGWEYVDAAASFMNEDGSYADMAYTSDGFWPNKAGVRIMGEAIRQQILDPAEPKEPEVPKVTATLTPAEPDGADGWYVTAATLELASEADTIEYRFPGGEWITYEYPVTLPDGDYTLEYRGVVDDHHGETGQLDVRIDTGAPTVTAEIDAQRRLVIVADDEASGVALIEYAGRNGKWVKYSEPVVIDNQGRNWFQIRAVDNVGHVSELSNLDVPPANKKR